MFPSTTSLFLVFMYCDCLSLSLSLSLAEKLKGMMIVDTWLGLRDDDNGENWHWVDGTLFDWTNWGEGEPNGANGEEHCGEVSVKKRTQIMS